MMMTIEELQRRLEEDVQDKAATLEFALRQIADLKERVQDLELAFVHSRTKVE